MRGPHQREKEFPKKQIIPLISRKNGSEEPILCQLLNQGMIATGNHWYFDSLRGAPPPGGSYLRPSGALGGQGPPQFETTSNYNFLHKYGFDK